MVAAAGTESRSQQQRFDRAGRKADEGLAGIAARLAAFRDAAADKLPFMGKRQPADASTQTFYCSGVSLAAAANSLCLLLTCNTIVAISTQCAAL